MYYIELTLVSEDFGGKEEFSSRNRHNFNSRKEAKSYIDDLKHYNYYPGSGYVITSAKIIKIK